MRFALMIAVLFVGSSEASACGNPLLWSMLFAKVPEAKVVYEAELAARAKGEVQARVYEAKPGETYHAWSKAWLLTLAAEMQPAMNKVLEPGETITILLADEVAVLRFTGGDEPELIGAGGIQRIETFDLITTINVLNGAWRNRLSYEIMISNNLISTGRSASDPSLSTLFSWGSINKLTRAAGYQIRRRVNVDVHRPW